MANRNFWSNQLSNQTTDTPSQPMRLIRRPHPSPSFELAIGQVRLDLSPRDVLKLRSLLDRSASVYLDHLRDDEQS